MGLIERIILAVYTVALAIISFLTVLISLGWRVPMDKVYGALRDPSGRVLLGMVAVIFFGVSVKLLYSAFHHGGSHQHVVHDTELGEVRISAEAVENLINRVSRQVKGVRDVRPLVVIGPEGLKVRLRVWVTPDVGIPGLSQELQEEIRRYVRNVVGVAVVELNVLVENITTEPRRGRVR